ncbi:MAG: sigma-70 family RNA polymerase sigma factor [Polyangiaceae bacterium]
MVRELSESARNDLPSHERFLFGLCYRMTGSTTDAQDIVQETFTRALEHPPEQEHDLRPWLVRVAMNLARDAYRRRKKRSYEGPWLPALVETTDIIERGTLPVHARQDHEASELPSLTEPSTTEGRYDLLESASYAFLVAMEALRPRERAVLLLRDVLDYSVSETAEALSLSEANVKTTLHRARKTMEGYDSTRNTHARLEAEERNREALFRFVTCLAAQDMAGVEALLAEGVRALTDGGSEFMAAKLPVLGRSKVALFYTKLTRQRSDHGIPKMQLVSLNGSPALLFEYPVSEERLASRVVLRIELDSQGKIAEIHSVLATEKLAAISTRC